MTVESVSIELINTCKGIEWQIISTNEIYCASVLIRSIKTCEGIVCQIISTSTFNCTVMFWDKGIVSNTVYMYHYSVAEYF